MSVVEAHDLKKEYRGRKVVKGVSLQIDAGEFAALIGPNGAGKSTFVEMIEGQRRPTSGMATLFGLDPHNPHEFRNIRTRLGVVLQRNAFEPALRLRDALARQESIYSRRYTIASLVEALDLGQHLGTFMGKLSEGTKRRADLAVALIGRPDLLILDEPTAGLDPSARQAVHALLTLLLAEGVTILMTSHHLDEIEKLASTVHVLKEGRIIRTGSPTALVRDTAIGGVIEFDRPQAHLAQLPQGGDLSGSRVRYTAGETDEKLREIQSWSASTGLELANLSVTRPTLDDVYSTLLEKGESK